MSFVGVYECSKVPVICWLVELIEQGIVKKDYSQIVFDLLEVDRHLYQAHNDGECVALESYGHFYP